MIYPLTTGFHWGALDFQWYIEGCQSRPGACRKPNGFHDVNRFITLEAASRKQQPVHSGLRAGRACRPRDDSARRRGAGRRAARHAASVGESVGSLGGCERRRFCQSLPASENSEFNRTLSDIRIVSQLGSYYADKIRGATQLALFRASRKATAQGSCRRPPCRCRSPLARLRLAGTPAA